MKLKRFLRNVWIFIVLVFIGEKKGQEWIERLEKELTDLRRSPPTPTATSYPTAGG